MRPCSLPTGTCTTGGLKVAGMCLKIDFGMNGRLKQIIQYKAGGRQRVFAGLMGWSPSYLNKLLKGVNFGLQPVLAVLEKFPDIDARWFLTGEGSMLSAGRQAELSREALSYVQEVLELERYIRVMSPGQLRRYEAAVLSRTSPAFSPEEVSALEACLSERAAVAEDRVVKAMKKSEELCSQQTVRK